MKNKSTIPFFYEKRDLLLKNSFDQSQLDLTKQSICFLNTNLNRGIESKKDLVIAGFFISLVGAQKAVPVRTKKSSALYKNRKNELFGWKITLRKNNLFNFLRKLNTFVQVQEGTDIKITNISSTIEFNDSIIPTNLTIHIKK